MFPSPYVKFGGGLPVVKQKNDKEENIHRIYLILYVTVSSNVTNRIGGVMVSVLTSSVVDHGFEPRSGQTKDYKFGLWLLR